MGRSFFRERPCIAVAVHGEGCFQVLRAPPYKVRVPLAHIGTLLCRKKVCPKKFQFHSIEPKSRFASKRINREYTLEYFVGRGHASDVTLQRLHKRLPSKFLPKQTQKLRINVLRTAPTTPQLAQAHQNWMAAATLDGGMRVSLYCGSLRNPPCPI